MSNSLNWLDWNKVIRIMDSSNVTININFAQKKYLWK